MATSISRMTRIWMWYGLMLGLMLPLAGVARSQGYVYLVGRDRALRPVSSPDGQYALVGSEDGKSDLWIEDGAAHGRRRVLGTTVVTVTVGWSPDSKAFFVNDRVASNVGRAYLYDPKTLSRVDLVDRIAAADRGAMRFMVPFALPGAPKFDQNARPADHAHLYASRWLDAATVEVFLVGHTDSAGTPEHIRPSQCFSLHYRVSRNGVVQKLGQTVADEGTKACEDVEDTP